MFPRSTKIAMATRRLFDAGLFETFVCATDGAGEGRMPICVEVGAISAAMVESLFEGIRTTFEVSVGFQAG